MSTFWSIWISVIVLGTVLGCWWLILATRKGQVSDTETERTTGHSFDGIEEYDNPLPKWWFYLYVSTCVFSLGYLALYPGLGNFEGLLGWTSTNQWEAEVAKADDKYGEIYAQYGSTPIPELATNSDALKVGQRLFANNCAVCHGSAARGQVGFPNLTNDDWLYGGTPDDILMSIRDGRMGNMPPKGVMPNMTNEQVDQVVNYVLSFSGREKDSAAAKAGEAVFAQGCAACHGADGKGNQAM
ncbi:MAG TPA: cytochrome-c oxidase, cbb3-type subunit III, partial [Marinobacter sp.]|nr:cytochrome-c oxidase, cbb3-type subunit III [Marinobacter sp.]